MSKARVLVLVLAVVLLLPGCAAKPTTTTTGPATTSVPTSATTSSTTTTAPATSTASTTYSAELSGKEVVPAIATSAAGSAILTVDATGTRVHFVLKVSNIADVTAARVKLGKPGTNGQGLLILFPGPPQHGAFTGTLAEGNFNASALIGSLTGKTIADFVALIQSGQVYVNVGTAKNPAGEIRGQVH